MSSLFHKRGGGLARAIAIMGATLVLFAQLIGAIHFHERALSRDGIATAAVAADQGLCPVCQLALHSSLTPTSAPFVEPLEVESAIASTDSSIGFHSFDSASALTRAPPAAA